MEDMYLQALKDLCTLLSASPGPAMIIGGLAASVLGHPRFTADIDATIILPEESLAAFLTLAEQHGFQPRISDVLPFARQSRVLLLQHASTGVPCDISLAGLPFEYEALAARENHEVEGLSLPLPQPEDLVIYKAVAHRPKDMEDMAQLLARHGSTMNLARIRDWVQQFAEALETPELLEDLESLISRYVSAP